MSKNIIEYKFIYFNLVYSGNITIQHNLQSPNREYSEFYFEASIQPLNLRLRQPGNLANHGCIKPFGIGIESIDTHTHLAINKSNSLPNS